MRDTTKAREVFHKNTVNANNEVADAVREAYASAGTYYGAAQLLNEGDITPIRSELWTATKVMRVLKTIG